MSVEEDTRPKLAELCNELAHLQLAKTRGLVVQLCEISPDDIDYAHVDERRQKYCRFWLEKDPRATWTKLVKALIAPSLEEFTLAEDIRRKYCPWLPEIILGTTPESLDEPRLQEPRSSTTISREGERSLSLQSRSSLETTASSFDTDSPFSPRNNSSFSSSVEESPTQSASNFCFCETCTFQQFLYGKVCPKLSENLELPYLNTKGLSPGERDFFKGTLQEELKSIRDEFRELLDATIKSLNDIEPGRLADYLQDVIEDEPHVRKEKKPLPDYLEQLEKADSVRKIIKRVIKPHYSFFNYEIIRQIIEKSGLLTGKEALKDALEALKKYDDKLDKYCKRRVYECPPVFNERTKIHATIHLKWENQIYNQFTLDGIRHFKNRLIRVLEIRQFDIDIVSVDDGCVQMLWQMPHYLVLRVFPLQLKQEVLLHDDLKVTELYCWDYKYTAKAFEIKLALNSLEKELTSVEASLSKQLAEKEQSSKAFFKQFRIFLLSTKLTGKHNDLKLLKGHLCEISSSSSTTAMLTRIRPFWDTTNPCLLDSVVQKFGDETVKRQMNNCKERLIAFESDAMLFDYQIACAGRKKVPLPNNFTQVLKLRLSKATTRMSLKESQHYHEALLQSTSFHPSTLRFMPATPLHDHSTTLIWYIPTNAADVVKEHVSERIFYDSDVPIESMTLDGTPIQEYREYQKGLRLITACREHDMEGVTRILASGVDPNSRNTEQETPLTVACAEGYADAVLALLNANADINLKENDLAPLNIASYNGRTEVVKVLLDYRNCIVDILDEDDHTPLHRACFNGHTNVVQLLIKHSADYLRTCSDGSTALHQAANYGNYETVNFLLSECNFPVNVTDNKKETPLHWASYKGQVEVMELLIEARRELINAQDDAGLTPLMMAANEGYVNGVKLLVNYQANGDAQNKEGLTALMMASQQGHEEIVNTLINAKADVNICENSIGWSAVFFSAKEGHLDITKQLISAGANIALRDKYDTTAMDQAIVHGRTSLYPLLAPGKLQKETAVHQKPSAIIVNKVMQTSEKIKEKLKRLDNWLKSTVKKEEFYRKQSQKSMEESSSQTLHA